MNRIKKKLVSQKGGVAVLVFFTIFTFIIVLTAAFLGVGILRRSQAKSDIEIRKIYGRDVSNIENIYNSLVNGRSYTVTYNKNIDEQVTDMPTIQEISVNNDTHISDQIPKCENYIFLGWGDEAEDDEAEYNPGDIYEERKNIELYAIWVRKVDYIESSGTQYIDTGYYWKNENIEIFFDGTVITNDAYQSLFGNEENIEETGNNRNFAGIPHGNSGNFNIYVGGSCYNNFSLTLGTRTTLDIKTTKDKTVSLYKDNALVSSATYTGSVLTRDTAYITGSVTNYGNIYIFSNFNSYRGTNANPIQNIGKMRLYSFKMYDGGQLVRSFIPCEINKDGDLGLYDEVNNVFYANRGTGDFTTN